MIEAVIFDYARTLVNIDAKPPQLYPGVEDMLKTLRARGLKMAFVSRGKDAEIRRKEFIQLGLEPYFDYFETVGPDGTKDFRPLLEKLEVRGSSCVVFGDRVRSEIEQGNKIGATTIWLQEKGGKFANELHETDDQKPDYTIHSRNQFIQVLDSINAV